MKILILLSIFSCTTAFGSVSNNMIFSRSESLVTLAPLATPLTNRISNAPQSATTAAANVSTDTSAMDLLDPQPFATTVTPETTTPLSTAPAKVAPIPHTRPATFKVASLGETTTATPPATTTRPSTTTASPSNPYPINLSNLKGSEPRMTTNAGHATLSCRNPTTSFSCMACNCQNEAAGRYDDMLAVSLTVMTRANLSAFPDTVCGVVKERSQFSWFNPGMNRRSVPKGSKCFKAADQALTFKGFFADHYHASYVAPAWARNMRNKKVVKIGAHTYYLNSRIPTCYTASGPATTTAI